MWSVAKSEPKAAAALAAPILDLSGPKLRRAFEHLCEAAEDSGGVERYVDALALKSSLFADLLGKGRVSALTEVEFCDLCAFIVPARRRVGIWLACHSFAAMRQHLVALLEGWSDLTTADARLAAFTASFPADREYRWARDLAAEVIHFTAPQHYPLMTRWMWDARVNTGVLREIWYCENGDAAQIAAPDSFATFAALRGELEAFLEANGVFRDLPFYVDLLCAHIYAAYINDRGGQYLRADFTGTEHPMAHTHRLLGLDAADSETGRTRLKLSGGKSHVLGGLGPDGV